MRTIAAILLAAALPGAAFAQTSVATPPRFAPAPWWMDQPIIASTGYVKADVLANRAAFSASFQVVGKTAPEATKAAADKVRELGRALAAYDPSKVVVQTTFSMRPIYDQYRNREGNLVDNQRADQIDAYEVNANVSVEVRDVALAERAYATVLAARPTSTQPVYFSLQPDSDVNTALYGRAVLDAARRARLSIEATGARLGPVKLIDPTGRACETDVLVAGARRVTDSIIADDIGAFPDRNIAEAISRAAPPAPPPPPPPPPPAPGGGNGLNPADMQLPLQAPLQTITAKVCVVYGLAG
jgi:uncharacterized protein YggE